MNEWKYIKLVDIADVKLSNVDKITKLNERAIRLCNYTDVYNNSFINAEKAKNFMIATCNENEYNKFLLKKGQVALTKDSETSDDIGISTYISEDFHDVVLGYHLALITPIENKLNGRFLHYLLHTKQSRTYFENNASGSGQRYTLALDCIKSIVLNIPDISTQQKISAVLSTLDDKIDLNERINKELEQMIKTLYEYWFLQFDYPNGQGKPYKSSGGIMVWNEELKREIPVEWEVKNLFDITNVSTSSVNPLNFPNKEFRHYSIPSFDETGTYKKEFGKEIMSNKIIVYNSDLLVSKLNPWFNRVVYATKESDLICSSEFVVWRTESSFIKNYLYMIAKDKAFIDYCTRSSSGTSHSHRRVNPQVMMKYRIPFNKKVAEHFGSLINSAIEMVAEKKNEIQNMTQIRNWLLPMLMNGQVKIINNRLIN